MFKMFQNSPTSTFNIKIFPGGDTRISVEKWEEKAEENGGSCLMVVGGRGWTPLKIATVAIAQSSEPIAKKSTNFSSHFCVESSAAGDEPASNFTMEPQSWAARAARWLAFENVVQ